MRKPTLEKADAIIQGGMQQFGQDQQQQVNQAVQHHRLHFRQRGAALRLEC